MREKKRATLKHIKNQLSSYEYWMGELFQNDDQLITVRRMIEEPKVTQYSDEPSVQGTPDGQHNQFQGNLMHEEKLVEKRMFIEKKLFACVLIISECEELTQEMIYAKYIKDIQDIRVSEAHNYSRISMYRKIDKELSVLSDDDTLYT